MSETIQRNTPEEIIEVVQAFLRGEKIESSELGDSPGWDQSGEPAWQFDEYHYRVAKPEPIEVWMNVYKGGPSGHAYCTKDRALAARGKGCIRTIKLAEAQ